MGPPKRYEEGVISREFTVQYNHEVLQHRGVFDKNGLFSRNGLRDALLEFKWLLLSHQFDLVQELSKNYDEFSPATIKLSIDTFLDYYTKAQVSHHMSYAPPSTQWFLANIYTPLENLIIRYYGAQKISRHEMRMRFLGIITETAQSKGGSIQETAFWFISSYRSVDSIKDLFYSVDKQIIQPLGILYIVSIIGEFATDINISEGRDLGEMLS
ncbi:MAG: hypothetical protein PHH70_01125 [Candidatus Gracilibacteria bacterium]|nr:hypothetical protein [Candidatus Gracilibacteria bacterium]